MNLAEKLWAKVDKREGHGPAGDCWVWTGHLSSAGYGVLYFGGRTYRAHRAAWLATYGPIPAGEGYHGTCVCHRCDNRACVRPEHLFLGTQKENVLDASVKKRIDPRKSERAHRAKLKNSEVRAIRKDPRLLREIAEDYGVSMTTVSGIRRRKLWLFLPE